VREETGAQIIKNFTGREATVLCDPTMCVSTKDWLQFSSIHSEKPGQKYVLIYFLGEASENVKNSLSRLSKDFEIVALNDLKSPKYYSVDPSEWVDYVNDASLFLTDSFHGVVFSLILQTPFAVYRRVGGEDMQTRVTNVLKKFNMENRFEMTLNNDSLFDLDFSKTDEIIEMEKIKMFEFLNKSLNVSS
jgi:hypothetical protein